MMPQICFRIHAYSFKNCSGIFKINRTDGVLRSFPKGPYTMPKSLYLTWQEASVTSTQLGFEPVFLADHKSKSCSSCTMGPGG